MQKLFSFRPYLFVALTGIAVSSLAIVGCSTNSPTSPDLAASNLRIQAEMSRTSVYPPPQIGTPAGATDETGLIDSIRITSVEFLAGSITLNDKDIAAPIGTPIIFKSDLTPLMVDQSGPKLVAEGNMLDAGYDKLSIGLHRMTDAEVSAERGMPQFAAFATPDRYSVVISGALYRAGIATPFSYGAKLDEAFTFDMPNYHIYNGIVSTLALSLDPNLLFVDAASKAIIDPTDQRMIATLDANFKQALSIIRR